MLTMHGTSLSQGRAHLLSKQKLSKIGYTRVESFRDTGNEVIFFWNTLRCNR